MYAKRGNTPSLVKVRRVSARELGRVRCGGVHKETQEDEKEQTPTRLLGLARVLTVRVLMSYEVPRSTQLVIYAMSRARQIAQSNDGMRTEGAGRGPVIYSPCTRPRILSSKHRGHRCQCCQGHPTGPGMQKPRDMALLGAVKISRPHDQLDLLAVRCCGKLQLILPRLLCAQSVCFLQQLLSERTYCVAIYMTLVRRLRDKPFTNAPHRSLRL